MDNLTTYIRDRWITEIRLPDGYEFIDENGNIIPAKKITIEKKKIFKKMQNKVFV